MRPSERKYVQGIVEGVFAFVEGIILPSIEDLPADLQLRFSLRERGDFAAGVFRSELRERYEVYLTSGLALETYAAIKALPAAEKRFLRRQMPRITSSRTRDLPSGFTFACAMTFVVAHELSHVLAGHVDFFRAARKTSENEGSRDIVDPGISSTPTAAPSVAVSKIKEIEADGFATFLIHAFRRSLAVSCTDNDEVAQEFESERISETQAQGLSRLSLFGLLLFAILLERHHSESDARSERPGFSHARLIYICVGHVLLERPDLARYDQTSRRVIFDPKNRDNLTVYFALNVLPALICCQRAADAAGVYLNIVPISANSSAATETYLVTEIAAILSGQDPGESAGGEQLAQLGDELSSWYETIQSFRQVKTQT